jgi:hypothetical protein
MKSTGSSLACRLVSRAASLNPAKDGHNCPAIALADAIVPAVSIRPLCDYRHVYGPLTDSVGRVTFSLSDSSMIRVSANSTTASDNEMPALRKNQITLSSCRDAEAASKMLDKILGIVRSGQLDRVQAPGRRRSVACHALPVSGGRGSADRPNIRAVFLAPPDCGVGPASDKTDIMSLERPVRPFCGIRLADHRPNF